LVQIDVPGKPRRSRGIQGSISGLKPRKTGPKIFKNQALRFGVLGFSKVPPRCICPSFDGALAAEARRIQVAVGSRPSGQLGGALAAEVGLEDSARGVQLAFRPMGCRSRPVGVRSRSAAGLPANGPASPLFFGGDEADRDQRFAQLLYGPDDCARTWRPSRPANHRCLVGLRGAGQPCSPLSPWAC